MSAFYKYRTHTHTGLSVWVWMISAHARMSPEVRLLQHCKYNFTHCQCQVKSHHKQTHMLLKPSEL